MTRSYVLISIGPVQSFISQARRTQDLYTGSRLLSLLAREAVTAIEKQGGSIVYPAIVDAEASSVPNRILFRIDDAQKDTAIKKAKDAVDAKWSAIAENVKNYIKKNSPFDEHIWTRQIDHWLEWHVASVPVTGHYSEDSQSINTAIARRKLMRDFSPIEEFGHKCSLTGEHEALSPTTNARLDVVQAYWNDLRIKQKNLSLLSAGERLCAISAVKRFAHESNKDLKIERFPSTSSIASAPFRAAIVENWSIFEKAVEAYIRELTGILGMGAFLTKPETLPISFYAKQDSVLDLFMRLDGDFLYLDAVAGTLAEQATSDKKDRAKWIQKNKTKIEEVRQALKEIYKLPKDTPIKAPTDYYAVLAMDGDRMGETKFETEGKHRDLSQTLAEFACDQVKTTIEARLGRVIYVGGDDLLALIPLKNVLEVSEQIRTVFKQTLLDERSLSATISAGIAIVHRTHPLQVAVQTAKAQETRAKEDYRTDTEGAVSFALLRRSGEAQEGGALWQYDGDPTSTTVIDVVNAMCGKEIAMQLPYDLESFCYSLVPVGIGAPGFVAIDSELRQLEFRRLFARRCFPQHSPTKAWLPACCGIFMMARLRTIGRRNMTRRRIRCRKCSPT